MIELRLNLPKSCQLDFELLADVPHLLFDCRKNDGSARRRSCGAALSALTTPAAFPARAAFSTLTAVAALAVGTLRAARADLLRTHAVRLYTCGRSRGAWRRPAFRDVRQARTRRCDSTGWYTCRPCSAVLEEQRRAIPDATADSVLG